MNKQEKINEDKIYKKISLSPSVKRMLVDKSLTRQEFEGDLVHQTIFSRFVQKGKEKEKERIREKMKERKNEKKNKEN